MDIKHALKLDALFLSDVSRIAGMHHNAAWNWKRKFKDFPESCGTRRGANNKFNSAYPPVPVLAWLIRHGKIKAVEGIDPDDYLIEMPEKEALAKPPQIDNSMAGNFMRGKLGAIRRAKPQPRGDAKTVTVRTEGIWPYVI